MTMKPSITPPGITSSPPTQEVPQPHSRPRLLARLGIAMVLVLACAIAGTPTAHAAQLNSQVSLSSSANPSPYGQPLTFTAQVSSPFANAPVPTGTVTFLADGTVLGTSTLDGAGKATWTTSALAPGRHTASAQYSGDANFSGNTGTLSQDIGPAPTMTTLTSSNNPSTYGSSVTFTATVTGGFGTFSGFITFLDGATQLRAMTWNGGSVSYTTNPNQLAVGSHSITARFDTNDPNNAGSTSPVLTQVVNTAPTSTMLTSSSNPSTYGANVTFTATVSGGWKPTGTISFRDGGTDLGTVPIPFDSSSASISSSTLALGPHSLTAVYSGDASHVGSTSPVLTQTVNPATSSTSLSSSQNPSVYGSAVTFTATVSSSGGTPGGSVTFADGGASLGTGTLSAGQATFTTSALAAGSHSIVATFTGSSTVQSSSSAPLDQAVTPAGTQTAATVTPNPSTFGGTVTISAQVSSTGGTPSGTVTFLDGASTIGTGTLDVSGTAVMTTATLAVGSHPISATYGGSGNFSSSTSPTVNETVQPAATSTSLTATPNPSTVGSAVTFTATVAAPGGPVTGTVTFMDGATTLGSAPVGSANRAVFTTSLLTPGSHPITAVYGGSTNLSGSTSPVLTQTVNTGGIATVIGIAAFPNPATVGAAVTIGAIVWAPGSPPLGTVTFTDGTTVLGTATLKPQFLGVSLATFTTTGLTQGTHVLTGRYMGSGTHAGSTSTPYTEIVLPSRM